MNDLNKHFKEECKNRVSSYARSRLNDVANQFIVESTIPKYSYNFEWLSRPIIQYPQDIVAMQELIWQVKPDLIIETGIAHGGSLILSASMLALLDLCEQGHATLTPDPNKPRRVIAVDIDIRAHNRRALEEHPLYPRLTMLEGSSIDQNIIDQVKKEAGQHKNILVCLDSMHTHDHVLAELEAYAPLVSPNSYCVVFDTVIEDMPEDMFPDRPWGGGNNPKTAVWEYLERLKKESYKGADGGILKFEIEKMIEHKLLITVAPDGYLKRI